MISFWSHTMKRKKLVLYPNISIHYTALNCWSLNYIKQNYLGWIQIIEFQSKIDLNVIMIKLFQYLIPYLRIVFQIIWWHKITTIIYFSLKIFSYLWSSIYISSCFTINTVSKRFIFISQSSIMDKYFELFSSWFEMSSIKPH